MDGWTTNRARPGGAEGVSVMGLVLALLLVADWVALVPTVSKHVPRIEISKGGETGVCSAVVFEVDKAAVPLDSLRDFIDSYQAERAKERK